MSKKFHPFFRIMVEPNGGYNAWPPIVSPFLNSDRDDEHWKPQHFDNSDNAVSFGFVATAILISMFLIMAIFERFLRPNPGGRSHGDVESQTGFNAKVGRPSPKMTNGVSVLMPGESFPTFIAVPAPVPCPPKTLCCSHQLHMDSISNPHHISNSNPNSRLSSSSSLQEN